MKKPTKPHINNVLSRLAPWTSVATHCDPAPADLGPTLQALCHQRDTFVCVALPRARFAQGGFALLTEPCQSYLLPDPSADVSGWDAALTAWALPYSWLAARAQYNAGIQTQEATLEPARALRFTTLTHIPGAPAAPQGFTHTQPVSAKPQVPQIYRRALETIRQAIVAGKVYQVNLTQRRSCRATREQVLKLWLEALSQFRPAFAYLWHDHEQLIACLSPEELWSCDGQTLVTAPIKGTVLDQPSELKSDKNRAEHTMIADLERNDLHRICQPGSVQVPILAAATAYGGVEHLVSLIQGQLQPGIGLRQILDALTPGGSITGAPKLAAINYIQMLETQPRGIYCGALALTLDTQPYRGFAALPIRTAEWHHGWMRYSSGGGITVDSDAETEYRELLRKQYWLKGFGDD